MRVERGIERGWGSYWVDSGKKNRERVRVILGQKGGEEQREGKGHTWLIVERGIERG